MYLGEVFVDWQNSRIFRWSCSLSSVWSRNPEFSQVGLTGVAIPNLSLIDLSGSRIPEYLPRWSQWKSQSRISPPFISVEVAIQNLSPIDISVNRNPESLPADLSGSHSGAPRVSSLSCSCICGRGGCTWHRGGKLTVRFSKRQNNILCVCSLILIAFKVPKIKKTALLMHYITF